MRKGEFEFTQRGDSFADLQTSAQDYLEPNNVNIECCSMS
jgi:hypothetical protein